jgi:uncharacterized protein YegP (UPF0339 family)
MTGMFELFTGSDASYRFRLTAPDGTVMALSRPFPDKPSAVAGIAAVREYAGMGLVTEITAPQNEALRQSVAARNPSGASAQNRPVSDGVCGAPVRLPRIRIPSAARFLGRLAATRNHQMIVRWRQTLGTRTASAELNPC